MPPTVTLESLQAAVSDLAKKEDKNEIPWQVWTTIGALLSFGFLFALFYAAWYLPWYIRQQKQQARESHPQRAEEHFYSIEFKEWYAEWKKWKRHQQKTGSWPPPQTIEDILRPVEECKDSHPSPEDSQPPEGSQSKAQAGEYRAPSPSSSCLT